MCLENRIALYSPHTAWDAVNGGVNDWLAKSMPFSSSQVIKPILNDLPNTGAGRLLEITTSQPITLRNAIDRVKQHVGVANVNVSIGCSSSLDTDIRTVALCAGSGSSVLKSIPANLYITGKTCSFFIYS